MRKLRLVAVAAAMFVAATANAGALLSATYSQSIQGVPIVLTSTTATGSLTGNTFTLDAGSWFQTKFCIGNPGNAACAPIPAPFAPPVTRINITFTMNGAVSGTTAQAKITPASGIHGLVRVMAKIGKSPAFTLLPIIVNAGHGGNVTTPPIPTPTSFTMAPSLRVFLGGDVWHIGAITQTKLTTMFGALPDAMATGNVSVDGSGNTHVNLVSLGRTKVRGLANSDTSTPTFLRLVYAPSVPEPGTLALLGAGVAGLVAIGRRKRS